MHSVDTLYELFLGGEDESAGAVEKRNDGEEKVVKMKIKKYIWQRTYSIIPNVLLSVCMSV